MYLEHRTTPENAKKLHHLRSEAKSEGSEGLNLLSIFLHMASPSTWIRNQLGLIEGSTVYEVKMLYITFMFVRKKENSVM